MAAWKLVGGFVLRFGLAAVPILAESACQTAVRAQDSEAIGVRILLRAEEGTKSRKRVLNWKFDRGVFFCIPIVRRCYFQKYQYNLLIIHARFPSSIQFKSSQNY